MRLQTHPVQVGTVQVGGSAPIRVQSMTTTDPVDVESTVAEIVHLWNAGCDYVRVTVPTRRSAEALHMVRKRLQQKGLAKIPLVADVHFAPHLAEMVAPLVEKVRINPGNFQDRKTLSGPQPQQWSEQKWKEAREKIADRLIPLLRLCQKYGTALRIGVNHGSLSDRILWRYGDTPEGMVESAMEFLDICEQEGFHQIIFSMKASDVSTMIRANLLLVERMLQRGRVYPLHLGVTEAGAGREGRIRSALGVFLLLQMGIGDTVRVSLAEDPVYELPVVRQIIHQVAHFQPENYLPRSGERIPASREKLPEGPDILITIRSTEEWERVRKHPVQPEHVIFPESALPEAYQKDFVWIELRDPKVPLAHLFHQAEKLAHTRNLPWERIGIRVRLPGNGYYLATLAGALAGPFLWKYPLGAIWMDCPDEDAPAQLDLAIHLLQVAGRRRLTVEYIACPSCGRTLFDLETVVQKIQRATAHLRNIRIAVMGCIVNGLGEIADADYGYIGSGPGRVHIYRGKQLVRKNVPEAQAIQALIEVIKEDGRWTDPPHPPDTSVTTTIPSLQVKESAPAS